MLSAGIADLGGVLPPIAPSCAKSARDGDTVQLSSLPAGETFDICASWEDIEAMPPKERGELAEARTVAKLMELRAIVAKPFGDSARWDLIVEAKGKISRLQVKSAWVKTKDGYAMGCGGSKRRYGPKNIDFLVGYVAPEDTWYIFPVVVIKDTSQLYIKTESNWKWARYRERWDLLFPKGQRPTVAPTAKIASSSSRDGVSGSG